MAEELEDTGEVLEVAETTEVIAVGTAEPSAITPVVSDHSGPKEIDPALEENINPTEEDPALEPDHTLEATEPTTALEDSQNTEVPRLSQLTGEERRSMFKILRKERLKDKWNKRFMVDDGDKLELRAENPEDEQIDGSEGEQEAMEHTHDSNDTGSSNEDIEIDTLRNSLDIPPMDAYPSFVEDDSDANATRKFPLEWETSVDDPLSGMALRPPTEPDSIQLKSDFLVDFELPSLSDISDEHSEEELPTVKSVHSVNETKGYFVDPLGGEEASSSSASVTSESTHMYLDQEEHSQQMDADSQSGLSEMSDIPEFADASPEPEPEPRGRALTFDDFSAALKEVVVVEVSEDTDEEMSRIQEIEKTVQDFIEDLLRDLEGSKYRSADRELRNKCDNYKLMRELLNLTDAYIIEKAENALLNTRLCEFYKRVRNTRVFRTLNLLDEGRYYYRYMNGLSRVDYLKQMLQSAKEMYARQMLLLVFDLQSAQTLVNCTEEHLEQTVRKTLLRPGRDFLGRVIERELRLMTSKRRDISDTRLYLITRKHTLGHIMKVSLGLQIHRIKELEI
ncbi:hypothetical protein KR009_005550 [Drosophila setifemur]|nr:hypothetical protein KR009_005550 [Drosophila setifemur]